MRVVICHSHDEASERVADMVSQQVAQKPDSVLGLATGGTMEQVYRLLRRMCKDGQDFSGVTTFNLDEYVGIPASHPQSYRSYMERHLFEAARVPRESTFIPGGTLKPVDAARIYEDALSSRGPIDLQLLGIGQNGHIGFNEPGSALGSRTREKALTHNTIEANSRFFAHGERQPTTAITMGIATILDSKSIILLATGDEKARAVAQAIEGPMTAMCPASALQMHQNTTAVLDQAAASQLSLAEYYRHAEAIQSGHET